MFKNKSNSKKFFRISEMKKYFLKLSTIDISEKTWASIIWIYAWTSIELRSSIKMFWFFWNRLLTPSILQRVGIRQLPGICWYPAKCIGAFLWIKAEPRIVSYSLYLYVIRPWQIAIFCQGRFLFSKSLAQNKNQWSFPVLRGGEYNVINQTMASNDGAEVTERIKDT